MTPDEKRLQDLYAMMETHLKRKLTDTERQRLSLSLPPVVPVEIDRPKATDIDLSAKAGE